MTGRIGFGKIIVAAMFLTVLASPVAAEWEVNVAEHPLVTTGNTMFTSNGEKSIVLVELRTKLTDEPIKPSDFDDSEQDDYEFWFKYNRSSGTYQNMSYYEGAYWYAEFESDLTKHGISGQKAEILFQAQGDRDASASDTVDSGEGWKTNTTNLMIGNYSLEVEEGLGNNLVPGNEVNVSVNVTDRSGVDTADVETVKGYFRNGTEQSINSENFVYNATSGLWEGTVTAPSKYGEKYILRYTAKNLSNNEYGAVSRFVSTRPDISGEIEGFSGLDGCETLDNVPVAARCEPGGKFGFSFNVTGVEVSNVTFSTYKVNRSSGEQVQLFNRSLSESEGLYNAEFDIPEINTTAFLDQFILKVNMSKGDRSKAVESVLNYESIQLDHVGGRTTSQGQDYNLAIQASRPISLSPYQASNLHDLRVNVSYPNGTVYENYSKSDFAFDDDRMAFEREVQIPQDAESGGWGISAFGSIYSQSDDFNSGFSVASSDASFDVNDTELFIDERGEQQFTMDVQNLLQNNITLRSNLSSELETLMNISEDGRFNVTSGEKEAVPVTVDMTDLGDDVLGEVNLTDVDTGFNRQASVLLATPGCKVVNGSLCGTREKWINVSVDSRNTTTEELEVYYTAGEGNSTDIIVSNDGDVSSFIEINKTEYNITDGVTIDINYTAEDRGNFTGNIVVDAENGSTIVYNTSLEANVTQTGSILQSDQSSIDLGTIPEGSSVSEDIEIENTAGFTVENLVARSTLNDVSIDGDNVNIQGGETKTITVSFSDVSNLGAFEITGSTPQGSNATLNLQMDGTTVENYSEQTEDLENRIDQLSPVSDTNLSDTLEQVNGMISEINEQWANQNYADARDTYQEADALLTYVANNKGTSDDGNDDDNNDDDTTGGSENDGDNDQNTGGDNQQTGNQQQNEGGGLPIIPIVVVLVILVVIGVVVYESYIPEEGDPLYDLLGEE